MAYGNDGFGQTYIEAPLFSSPLATYQGATAGDAQDGDNARLLRETMPVIAAYRAAVSTASPSLVGPIMLLLGDVGPAARLRTPLLLLPLRAAWAGCGETPRQIGGASGGLGWKGASRCIRFVVRVEWRNEWD